MLIPKGAEKRLYFRMNDTCVFKYHEQENDKEMSDDQLKGLFFSPSELRYLELCQQFSKIDEALVLSKKQKQIYQANQEKIKLILEVLFVDIHQHQQKVNLSDGGIGFYSDCALNTIESNVYIMILLSSHPTPLFIKGEFLYCRLEPQENARYQVGFQFDSPNSREGNIIRKHILLLNKMNG